MLKRRIIVSGALALGFPLAAGAAADGDLQQLREEIRQLREVYEARIQALEKRLQQAEAAAQGRAAPADSAAHRPAYAPPAGRTETASAFNPAVGLVLSATAGSFSRNPDNYAIPGFMLGEGTGPGTKGLSLGESELIVSANVDDKFYGHLTAALTPENTVAVEEAYILATGLGGGFTLKGGRFFSSIGYMNEQHPHMWDFVDTALPYRALLGNQYQDDGLQLKWVAPTELFLEIGGELMRGDGFPAGGAARSGTGARSAFARLGGDVGASHSWRAGLSYLDARPQDRLSGDISGAPDAFSGTSRTAIADFVWKWAPGGNPGITNFKLQGEYFRRRENGTFTADFNSVHRPANPDALSATQSGWYLQGVYQFMPKWRIGLRHDRLRTVSLDAGSNGDVLDTLGHSPKRYTVMVDWSNSEFSRVRLQYNRDQSGPAADDQVFLQYVMSLGAHGAHKF
jgi:hypothetical protein